MKLRMRVLSMLLLAAFMCSPAFALQDLPGDFAGAGQTLHLPVAFLLNGWIATLLTVSLLLWPLLREPIHGWYVAYGLGLALLQGLYNGSLPMPLLDDSGWPTGLHRVLPLLVLALVVAAGGRVGRYRMAQTRPALGSRFATLALAVWASLGMVGLVVGPDFLPLMFSAAVALELTLAARGLLLRFVGNQRSGRQARSLAISESQARLEAMQEAARAQDARVQKSTQELEQTRLQLANARAQADAASQAKQTFLANMSHEIRTPLNAMLGMGYLAAEYPMEPQAQACLHKSSAAAQSLLGLINDILDASRLDAGKMEVEVVPCAVRTLLQEAMDLHAGTARERGLALSLQVSEEVPDVLLGDGQKLQRIVEKLLSNAIKFTPQGGVSVVVDRENRDDHFFGLRITVSDTGIGMDPQQMAEVFSPFVQADSSLTRHHDGIGMGLRIAHGLTVVMGGKLLARSEPGQGSTLTLCLPMLQPTDRPPAGHARSP